MSPTASAKMMLYVAYFFLAFAMVWLLAAYDTVSAPARWMLDLLDWPFGDGPQTLDRNTQWLSSIGAGLVVMLSVMLIGIVVPALENSDRKIVKTTIIAFIAWYVVDSAGSIASGVSSNAIFNLVLLIPALIPLFTIRYASRS